MLKLIYKTILVSIISCVLMVGELSSFADSRGTLTRNNDGSYQRTNTYDMKATNKEPVMAIIAMLAVGFLGTRLLMYEKWTTDMTVAAASSGIYIAGEVWNLINAKKEMKELEIQATIRSDGVIDSKQVEYIKTLRESYEKQLKFLKTKKMLQNGALVGFLAAFAVALVKWQTLEGQYVSCEGAIAQATIAIPPLCVSTATTPVTAADSATCKECALRVKEIAGVLKGLKANEAIPEPSWIKEMGERPQKVTLKSFLTPPCASVSAQKSFSLVQNSCLAYLGRTEVETAYGNAAKLKTVDNQLINKFLRKETISFNQASNERDMLAKMIRLLIPNASAGILSALGLVGGAAAAFYSTQLGLAEFVDDYLYTPGARIFIWPAFAGITKIAIGVTEKKMEEVEDNIKKLDKILAETAKLQKGVKSSLAKINSVQLNLDQLYTSDEVISTTDKTGCLSGGVDSSQCQSLTSMNATTVGLQNLPEGLQSIVNSTTKVGDGVSNTGTLSASTLNQANALGSKSGALSKFLKKQQDSINDMLKKQGKGVIDFDLESRKAQSRILGITSDALKNKGQSPEGFLASIGMSGPSSASDKNSVAEKDKISTSKKLVTETGSATTTKTEEKKESFDFSEKKEEEQALNSQAVLANGMREGSSNDRYDMKGSDISKDNGSSIFDIITIRYMKSGYPKLLDEVK